MDRGAPYRELGDAELVEKGLEGHREAWAARISRYEGLIYSFTIRFHLREPDRSEVFQSVCVRLLEKLRGLRDVKSLPAWLISTTARLAMEMKRKEQVRQKALGKLGSVAREADQEQFLPPAEAQRMEEHALIRVAVGRLSTRCRRVVELIFLDDEVRSYREIANELGMPEGSLGPTRARCLAKLKAHLRNLGMAD